LGLTIVIVLATANCTRARDKSKVDLNTIVQRFFKERECEYRRERKEWEDKEGRNGSEGKREGKVVGKEKEKAKEKEKENEFCVQRPLIKSVRRERRFKTYLHTHLKQM
jgi:hypothetical protein